MAKLLQTTITGSLNISGSSLLMPLLTGSTDVTSGSAGQLWINNEGSLNLKLTQRGSFGTQNSPFSCLGAWSNGGAMSIARHAIGAGGTQNAAILFGGRVVSNTDSTEEYDGASWSAGGSLITARAWLQGAGKQNAALAIAGYTNAAVTCNEEYNGSTWSAGGAVITGRFDAGGAGFQNAAILYGGDTPSESTCTEEYNGSSWEAGGAMINARNYSFGTGTQTSVITGRGVGGALTEFYNGVTWSTGTNTVNIQHQRAVSGTANAALFSGGNYPGENFVKFTEEWNGNTFSVGNDLLTGMAQGNMSCIGTINSAIVAGGYTPSKLTCTQEYTKNLLQPFTYNAEISTDSYSGGGRLITSRFYLGGAGETADSSLAFGGMNPGNVTCTEEYNGDNWSAGGALINGGNSEGAGSQNAALNMGANATSCTEEYDGSSWAAGGALITGRKKGAGYGTQNAALYAGGAPAGTNTEEYNGTSWATGGALAISVYQNMGGGTQNDAVSAGGFTSAYVTNAYKYNGTSWSAINSLGTCGGGGSGHGATSDDVNITFGFIEASTQSCTTCNWNGTTWNKTVNFPFTNYYHGGSKNSSTSFGIFGGTDGSSNSNFFSSYCQAQDIDSSIPYCLGAWSNNANIITARAFTAQGGTSNAAFLAGGTTPAAASPYRLSCNEEYNGTVFSAGGALITARGSLAGGGTQNAGIAMAGGAGGADGLGCTEEYDGSTFSSGGNMIAGRQGGSGGGTQNAAITTLGYAPPTSVACTEHYDGSSWSAANAINNIRSESTFAGSQNSAIVMGGNPGPKTCVEGYDGTTWFNSTAMPTARAGVNLSGTQNDAIMAGGGESATSDAFAWDGIAFKGVSSITNARFYGGVGSQGTSTSHLFMGGRTPTYLANTEEWNCANYNIGAWSMNSNFSSARYIAATIGDDANSAGLVAGSAPSPNPFPGSEFFDGAAWGTGPNVNTARFAIAGMGSVNAGLVAGGATPTRLACAEEYDGTSFSAGGAMIIARALYGGSGQNATQDAGIVFSGDTPSATGATEEYDGSSWSAGGTLSTARYGIAGSGTQNTALAAGGTTGGAPAIGGYTEEYNGSSWSTGANLAVGRYQAAMSGPNTNALASGGRSPGSPKACSERYDGNVWSTAEGLHFKIDRTTGTGAVGGANMNALGGGLYPGVTSQNANYCHINPINQGIYCFTKNLAPGNTDSSGTSYSSGY